LQQVDKSVNANQAASNEQNRFATESGRLDVNFHNPTFRPYARLVVLLPTERNSSAVESDRFADIPFADARTASFKAACHGLNTAFAMACAL
jgi:hypothetical protein